MSDLTTTPETQNLDKLITQFESTLMGEDSPRGKLWKAWHFVQVYSTWGLRLPATENALKNVLKVGDVNYDFFPTMLDGYQEIHASCKTFQDKTFPRVIKLGEDLKSFAEDNRSGEDSIWAAITEMMNDKESYPDALELILDLQGRATENVRSADEVATMLSGFSSSLESANGKLKTAQDKIEADDRTSSATIANLQGGEDVTGSIANVNKLMNSQKEEYDHDVVVAATSPSYAWFFPFGTIAAATVAGIYGKKAVDALKNYEELKAKAASKSLELNTALQAHGVQSLAGNSVTKTREQTALAIEQITVVKNAWSALAGNLATVATKVDNMTKTKNEQEVLKGKIVVKLYARQAGKAWDKLWPTIVALTDKPYIVVEDGEKTVGQIIQDIELAMANPAVAN